MNEQLPPPRRRTTPDLPDPMAPTVPAGPSASIAAESTGAVIPPAPQPHLAPAFGVSSSMVISVRTSERVRAMFDALAADDSKRNRARPSNRYTLETLVTEAYQRRIGRAL